MVLDASHGSVDGSGAADECIPGGVNQYVMVAASTLLRTTVMVPHPDGT